VIVSQSFNDELTGQLDEFKDNDIRIILGNFNESWARTVFCDAFHKSLYGDKIQWLIVGMYEVTRGGVLMLTVLTGPVVDQRGAGGAQLHYRGGEAAVISFYGSSDTVTPPCRIPSGDLC
jgi:hypothetical protein